MSREGLDVVAPVVPFCVVDRFLVVPFWVVVLVAMMIARRMLCECSREAVAVVRSMLCERVLSHCVV